MAIVVGCRVKIISGRWQGHSGVVLGLGPVRARVKLGKAGKIDFFEFERLQSDDA